MSSITANVGSYGTVKGFTSDNVAEFRGLPFGKIPARFRRAELVKSVSGEFDATKYGPFPAQMPENSAMDLAFFGEFSKTFAAEEAGRTMSEDCLNLNIVTPKNAIGKSKLPVMVWLYGGGFSMGANSRKMYHGKNLVEHSISLDEPIVYLAVNYRLNFFGFLASKELIKDNAAHGGGVGNYGLFDQRLALEWVHQNIQYFGGDPSRITIFGESAGSASVHAHICAGKPLFNRAILQSGVLAGTLGPARLGNSRTQGDFDILVKKFGLEGKDDQGKVDALRALPMEDLIKSIPDIGPFGIFYPVDDSHVPGGFFDKGSEETHQWLYHPEAPSFMKGVMAGDCENEGIIFYNALINLAHNDVLDLLHKSLPESLLEKYGLTKSQTSQVTHIGQLMPLLISLKTDELFAAGINKFLREFSKTGAPTYSYHFDRPNLFQCPMNGVAHHAIDLAYTFGNFERAFSNKKDWQLSETLMKYWIDFANGKEPWSSVAEGKALHIKTDATSEAVRREKVTSRRWDSFVEIEKSWDKVRETGNLLIHGKTEH